ncbi:centriolar coiled-coil protein of 110 kDa isoform X2 [Antechinus flavipes]|nr:centriolar coiled-coil protein of 110 kDa isoform X2 [Antechinus flavipes]XP_051857670.1 centriolar coiled-coil protein of 110 kDa isoform X2 [Antechinus flavipes]XP_051857677.1 centriolar coiled-coil protein of 110 kDa isoform X2 [Antechinus flavipes]
MMEEYEKFCEKSLVRIQGELLSRETFPSSQPENISFIRFHGVALLSPLLSVERRKEMQQEKQKALDIEARKQISRKKALLNRVQEILENVQIRKAPNINDFDQWEPEAVYLNSEVRDVNVPTILPKDSLPSLTEESASTKVEETIEILPSNTTAQVKLNGTDSDKDIGACISIKQRDSPNPNQLGNETSPDTSSDTSQDTLIIDENPRREGELEPTLVEEVTSDPYMMSLQNLMKKSKEYIEREQTRRSMRNNSKKSFTESHSDKESDAIKMNDSEKENAGFINKNSSSVSLDKPSLNKSNILLQSATTQMSSMNALASFSKGDIPVRVGTPTLLDSDEDEDFKVTSTFDPESSVVKSFTGSYAKLPSPEPSVSPKMHRRRPKSSSTGHILINNPVNAYELSPKEKGRAMELIIQDVNVKINIPESVPKFPIDLTEVCSSKVHIDSKNASGTGGEESILGKSNELCQHSVNQLENKVMHVTATMEGQIASDGREPYKTDNNCTIVPKLHEPYAISQCIVSQKCGIMNVIKSTSVLEKNCNSQVELNKSYDVQNPSPLLMQCQNKRQQMDTPNGSCGNEQLVENSFEKVKRRLDLDVDAFQKENSPYILTTGTVEQERRWIQEKRFPKGPVYINKNEMLEISSREGEEMLKNKMLAFEEMRKRLEEQHAQQLSILIAEQEKEQEKLQKEIEEQERMLKEKKDITAEAPEVNLNNAVELEWRKISDSGILETMLSQVDTLHIANSNSSGFTNSALQHSFGSASEVPFYLWGSSTNSLPKIPVTRPLGRGKPRWSQVFSLEVQAKFDKITAVAKGFLTRRLLQTEKVKHLRQTVKDTMEFIRSFQSEAPLKRGSVSAQDASLQERVLAQLRAALFDIHDIFFIMDATERMSILHHDREVRKEKMLRQMDKMKNPRASLSAATQKSLDRKKYMKAAEMGMPNKKILIRQKPSETRVLQPNQGQNAPIHRPLCRQGTPKTSVKGVEQSREKSSDNRMRNRMRVSGAYAGKTQRKQPNVATI